jgi:hypothetical protein
MPRLFASSGRTRYAGGDGLGSGIVGFWWKRDARRATLNLV